MRSRRAAVLLTVLVLLPGAAACSTDRPAETELPLPTATPEPTPSVWTTGGAPDAARSASAALLRVDDLPAGYSASPLTELAPRTVRPDVCRTLLGPATGLLDGATGRASTAFVAKDLTTAVAHSIGLYGTPGAGVAALDRARRIGRACARTVVNGTTFVVTSVSPPGSSTVTLVLRQAKGFGQTTVTQKGRLVSVLAVAGRPPGPTALINEATRAVNQHLAEATAASV